MVTSPSPMASTDDKNDSRSLQQTISELWMGVLGVINQAETEVQKASQKVIDRVNETVGASQEQGHKLATELMGRMRRNREEFERRIDDGVKAAIAKVRAPIDKELAQLRTRLERITQRLDRDKKSSSKSR